MSSKRSRAPADHACKRFPSSRKASPSSRGRGRHASASAKLADSAGLVSNTAQLGHLERPGHHQERQPRLLGAVSEQRLVVLERAAALHERRKRSFQLLLERPRRHRSPLGGPVAPSTTMFSAVGAVSNSTCPSSGKGGTTRAPSASPQTGLLRAAHAGALFEHLLHRFGSRQDRAEHSCGRPCPPFWASRRF